MFQNPEGIEEFTIRKYVHLFPNFFLDTIHVISICVSIRSYLIPAQIYWHIQYSVSAPLFLSCSAEGWTQNPVNKRQSCTNKSYANSVVFCKCKLEQVTHSGFFHLTMCLRYCFSALCPIPAKHHIAWSPEASPMIYSKQTHMALRGSRKKKASSCFYALPSSSSCGSVERWRQEPLVLMTSRVYITEVQTPPRKTGLKDGAQKLCSFSNRPWHDRKHLLG